MELLLKFQATLKESLFVSITHNQLKLAAIGLDAIRPEVFTHETASVFKLLDLTQKEVAAKAENTQAALSQMTTNRPACYFQISNPDWG